MAKTEITPSGLEKALVEERFIRGEEVENIYSRDTGESERFRDRCNCSWQGSPHGGVGGGTTR